MLNAEVVLGYFYKDSTLKTSILLQLYQVFMRCGEILGQVSIGVLYLFFGQVNNGQGCGQICGIQSLIKLRLHQNKTIQSKILQPSSRARSLIHITFLQGGENFSSNINRFSRNNVSLFRFGNWIRFLGDICTQFTSSFRSQLQSIFAHNTFILNFGENKTSVHFICLFFSTWPIYHLIAWKAFYTFALPNFFAILQCLSTKQNFFLDRNLQRSIGRIGYISINRTNIRTIISRITNHSGHDNQIRPIIKSPNRNTLSNLNNLITLDTGSSPNVESITTLKTYTLLKFRTTEISDTVINDAGMQDRNYYEQERGFHCERIEQELSIILQRILQQFQQSYIIIILPAGPTVISHRRMGQRRWFREVKGSMVL